MKDVQQLIQGQLVGQEQPKQHEQSDFVRQVMNRVFSTLRLIYPSSFAHQYKDATVLDQTKQLWIQAFIENKIDSELKIKRGFERARASNRDYVPTVGVFVNWCVHEPEDGSFERFINRDLRCFAERHTSSLIGFECRTRLESSKAKRLWYETLSRTNRQIRDGELQEPKPITQSIEPPKQHYDLNQMDRVIDEMITKGHISAIRGPLRKRFEQRVQSGEIKMEIKHGDRHE